jgi:hypothetical protein
MLRELAAAAARAGCARVVLPYVRGERNQPIADFLAATLGGTLPPGASHEFSPSPAVLAAVEWRIPEQVQAAPTDAEGGVAPRAERARASTDYGALAATLADLEALSEQIRVDSLSGTRRQRPYEAPQGAVEEAVARIWSQLLDLPRVGRDDHFFELGGHSLIATQLVSRCRDLYGVEVPLTAVFEQPTLREFSARLGTLLAQPDAIANEEMVEGEL